MLPGFPRALFALAVALALVLGCAPQAAPPTTAPKPAASGGASAPASQAAPQVQLRLAAALAPGFTATKAYMKLAEIAKQKSGGRIEIQVFHSGSLAGPDERATVEGAQAGSWEMGAASFANMSSFTKVFGAFDLPYMFENVDEVVKALNGKATSEAIAKDLAARDLVPIILTPAAPRQLGNNKKLVKTPAELRDLKIRTTNSPIDIATWKSWGALTTPVAWGEVYSALQQKVVDGTGNGFDLMYQTKFHEVLKYATEIEYQYGSTGLFMGKKAFDGLPKDLQTVLTDSAREALQWQIGDLKQEMKDAKDVFAKAGVEVYAPTPEEKKLWIKATEPVYGEFVAPGKVEPEMVDTILKDLGKSRATLFK